jgi:Lrp/AsnC family transcriptional regulator, leucine-responsive regulatory protein
MQKYLTIQMPDSIDIQILSVLQMRGRTRRNELAEKVGLSLPAVSERLRKLEERGYIKGYAAILNPALFGNDVTAFISVSIDSSRHYEDFLKHVDQHPDVLECHAVTGDGSHLLKVRTANTASLEKILSTIQSWRGVMRTSTNVVLSTRKETTAIQLDHINPQT